MARGGTHEASVTYMNISQGKIREGYKVTEATPGAQMRTYQDKETKETKTVWEVVDDHIQGWITDIVFFKDDRNNNKIIVKMHDNAENENYNISVNRDSRYGNSLMEKLPCVSFNKEVRIVPFDFMNDDGKRVAGVNIFQQETIADAEWSVKVPKKWTKEAPGSKPPFPQNWKEDEFALKDWQTANERFLVTYTKENVVPAIPKEPWADIKPMDKPVVPKSGIAPPEVGEIDDLPF